MPTWRTAWRDGRKTQDTVNNATAVQGRKAHKHNDIHTKTAPQNEHSVGLTFHKDACHASTHMHACAEAYMPPVDNGDIDGDIPGEDLLILRTDASSPMSIMS